MWNIVSVCNADEQKVAAVRPGLLVHFGIHKSNNSLHRRRRYFHKQIDQCTFSKFRIYWI